MSRAVLLSKVRGMAAEMRSLMGYKAQVKVRKSGVYLSAQGLGKPDTARSMVRDMFPQSRRTSGSYGLDNWDMTWRIDG